MYCTLKPITKLEDFKTYYLTLYKSQKNILDKFILYKNLRDEDVFYFVYNDNKFVSLLLNDITEELKAISDINLFKALFKEECIYHNRPELIKLTQEEIDEVKNELRKEKIQEYKMKHNQKPQDLDYSIYDYFKNIPEIWDYDDLKFYNTYLRCKKYKKLYWIGVILWMSSCLWGPYLFGIIHQLLTVGFEFGLLHLLVISFAYVAGFSFTTPVTLPLSFIIALFIYPAVLKNIIFNDMYPYNEYIMRAIHHSKNQEIANFGAVVTGSIL